MSAKKIRLQDYNCCPSCKGTTGIYFKIQAFVTCVNNWGGNPEKSKQTAVNICNREIKTALCADCGYRVEIVND